MAKRYKMRDHSQAPAWPRRTPTVAERRAEDDEMFSIAMDAVFEMRNQISREIDAFLLGLTDAELADLDEDDPRINRSVGARYRVGNCIVHDDYGFSGFWCVKHEQDRRAALTAHERVRENVARLKARAAA